MIVKEIELITKEFNTITNEYLCESEFYVLEEFITANTIDLFGNYLDDGELMLLADINKMRDLVVGESMNLGDSEAGLTVKRIKQEREK